MDLEKKKKKEKEKKKERLLDRRFYKNRAIFGGYLNRDYLDKISDKVSDVCRSVKERR